MCRAPRAKRSRGAAWAAVLAVIVWAFAWSAVTPACAQAPDRNVRELKPPFGLSWGETQDRLERLLKGAKANVVARRMTANDLEAWDVEGLVQSGLKRTVFYFKRGELVGVELQYQRDDWKDADYDKFMGEVRRRLEQRYGAGQQLVRRTEPEGTVTQTIVGYQWNLNNTAIELFFYSAKDGEQEFRTLSVHYKAF